MLVEQIETAAAAKRIVDEELATSRQEMATTRQEMATTCQQKKETIENLEKQLAKYEGCGYI
jgi:DNA-binding XRE family transcriptional regulator